MRDIAQNAPLIMEVFEENLKLKEKIRQFEVNDENMEEYNLREKLEVNMLFLTEVARKIDDSIRERQLLDERIERMAYLMGITPHDISGKKISSEELQELQAKVEQLNFEVLRSKQQKDEFESMCSTLKTQIFAAQEKISQLELDKSRVADSYEARIRELKDGYDKDMSGVTDSLKSELIDTRDQLEAYKRVCEEMESSTKTTEARLSKTIKQKEELLALNQAAVRELQDENQVLTSKVGTIESKLRQQITAGEFMIIEKQKMTEKMVDMVRKQSSLEESVEKMLKEKYDLQGQIRELKEKQLDAKELEEAMKRIKALETDVQREVLEKEKIQDELETVQDSYSYVLNEMVALSKKSINKLDGDDLETNYSKKTYKKSQREKAQMESNPKSLMSNLNSFFESERDANYRLKTEMSTLSLSLNTLKGEESLLKQELHAVKESKQI